MSACALREGQQQGLTSFNAFRRAARSAPSQTFSGFFLTQSLTSVTAANGNVIDQAVAKSTAARVRDSLRRELVGASKEFDSVCPQTKEFNNVETF